MNTSMRTRTLALATMIAGALVLVGCAPVTPGPNGQHSHSSTPKPTATLSTDPAPQSEDEAVNAAERTIANALHVRAQVNQAGGKDTSPLEKIATGTELQQDEADAQRINQGGFTVKGELKFEPSSGYANDLTAADGKKYPFASATITGCQDGSGYKVFNADGSAAQQPTQQRNQFEVHVIWDPTVKLWLVENTIVTGETC